MKVKASAKLLQSAFIYGSASGADALSDGNYPVVSCQGMDIAEQGKAHAGFYNQFEAVTQHPNPDIAGVYGKIAGSLKDKKLFICGHSLGGALALLHAAALKTKTPLLYTYGMPRTLTKSALSELSFPHFRHRNESDEVTSVPPGRGLDHPGARIFFLGKWFSVAALALPDQDPYGHHGKLVHFYQTDTRYLANIIKYKDSEKKQFQALASQVKLLVLPHLAAEDKATTDKWAKAALINAYPPGDNPSHGGGSNIDSHPSGEYAGYLHARLLGRLDEQQDLQDPYVIQIHNYLNALDEYKSKIEAEVSHRERGAMQLDYQLDHLLPQGQTEPEQFAISRLWQAPRH